MKSEPTVRAIDVAGKIAADQKEIETLTQTLETTPLWMPAADLLNACRQGSRIVSDLLDRFEANLMVAIIGPSGSGKSTLLNALAGVDTLSETGPDRPTTEQIVVACRKETDAETLLDGFDRNDVRIKAVPAAPGLENLVLIDTPDTDSTQNDLHIPLVNRVIEMADVLICVFDAENPKRKDHTDFMAPYIRRFHGESIIVTLNKCDRLEKQEMVESIVPEFEAYIEQAWAHKVRAILCTSGRSHLEHPGWENDAAPRSRLDQFDTLCELVFSAFDQDDFRMNQRRRNAQEIKAHLFHKTQREARRDQVALERISIKMAQLEADATQQALEIIKQEHSTHVTGITVRLYQELAQRWMGPVGWLIAIWSRFLIYGSAFASLFRFGNPVRQAWALISSFRHHQKTGDAVASLERADGIDSAMQAYRRLIRQNWTDIAEDLIQSRFDPTVRRTQPFTPEAAAVARNLLAVWQKALDREISRTARRLSHLIIQAVLNLPTVAILAYTGWLTVTHFIGNDLLPSDFFVHAAFTIAIFLFLSFFVFQLGVRLFGSGSRIIDRTFSRVHSRITSADHLTGNDIQSQIDTVLFLADENPDVIG